MLALAAAALLQAATPLSEVATLPKLASGAPTSMDYPPAALRRGAQGLTSARFLIRTDGTATGCVIVGSSGHDDLDQRACQIIVTRTRFSPALDAAGKPVASEAVLPVRWMMAD